MGLSEELKKKLESLVEFFKEKKVIVAFSGGVDSSLLAYLSNKYAAKTLLLIASSSLFSEKELREATQFAENYEIPYLIMEFDPLEDELFVANSPNRCYLCKTVLYSEILNIKEQNDFDVIVDGTNESELQDYRPGFKALKELGISVPYIDFNISKNEIRVLSKHFNLSVHSKPANACFATRVAYGVELNKDLLSKIRIAEEFLKNEYDFTQLRVRYHQGDLIRIELLKNEMFRICNDSDFQKIEEKLKDLGFEYITLDIKGFRTGSMNRMINL
ncbi:MAG: ATP-dependent sacrificial sulfur transferase LarE [Promethearchaeati archaeon]